MTNMSRRRFWAGKACFWQTVVSHTPVPNRNGVPWESDMNRAHGSMGLKIARTSAFHQLKTFWPTKTERDPVVHGSNNQPRC